MDLKSLPQNACPLCHEPALDMAGPTWTCRHCGCEIEFDADTRHGRITTYPARFASLRPHVGEEWLTRREMFERVDAAREAVRTASTGPRLPLGPIAVVALALVALCVMLSAIASALVLSPTIARTRRVISAAYQPTATSLPATATLAPTSLPAALDSPAPTQDAGAPTTAANELAPVITPPPAAPALTVTAEPKPTETPPQVVPTPTVELPPTFTPAPTVPAPPLASPIEAPPLPPTPAVVVATPTPQVEVQPSPTITFTAVPTGPPPPPLPPGPVSTPGIAVVITRISYQGAESLGEADEFVEVRNSGTVQQDVSNWSIKAFHGNQQVDSFVFDPGFIIAAGQACKIYTNLPAGPDNCGIVDGFARDEPLWPNAPSGTFTARLYNAQNIEVARFTY